MIFYRAFKIIFTDVYFVTEGAPTGAPLPSLGKPLEKMVATDWRQMVERGIVQFGM